MLAREVMSTSLAFCMPSDNCRKAAHMMREHDCGVVPVVADGDSRRVVGVVTDRDLTVRVLATDRDPENLQVGDVMTRDPITLPQDANMETVEQTMAEHRVRRVPVVDNSGRLVGVISQADIARRMSEHEVAEVVKAVSQPSRNAHV